MPSAKKEFYFFLLNMYAFLSFSYLIALARQASMIMNRSHEKKILDLFPRLGGKHSH